MLSTPVASALSAHPSAVRSHWEEASDPTAPPSTVRVRRVGDDLEVLPTVGRERDLSRIVAAFDSDVCCALVSGPAGIGKSSLARDVAARWNGPVVFQKLRGGVPFGATVDEARQVLAGRRVSELATDERRLVDLVDRLDAGRALWVLDDLHELGTPARGALMRTVAPLLRSGRLLLTSRDRWPASSDAVDLFEVRLRGLDQRDAHVLWSALDERFGAEGGFDAAYRATRGNPFLLRRAHLSGQGRDEPAAATLDALDADERFLVAALALTHLALPVRAAARLLPPERGEATLRRLVRGLVVDIDHGHVSLHDLLRDAIGHRLSSGERRAAQKAIVRVLSAEGGHQIACVSEVARCMSAVGDHAGAARWLARRSGELIRSGGSEGLLRAIDALPTAYHDRALAVVRVRALRRMLDIRGARRELARLVTEPIGSRALVRTAYAQTAALTGELDVAASVLDALSTERGSSSKVAVTRAIVETLRGHGASARDALGLAAAAASDPMTRRTLATGRAISLCLEGRSVEHEDAVFAAMNDFGDTLMGIRGEAMTMALRAVLFARSGRLDAAESYARRAASEGDTADPLSRLYVRALRATIDLERGERVRALEPLQEVRASFERAGHLLGATWADVALAGLFMLLGRRRDALALCDQAADRAAKHGIAAALDAIERCRRADPLLELREADETREAGPGRCPVRTRALEALRAAAAGRSAESVALLATIADRTRLPGYAVERVFAELATAATARIEGRRADATDALARAIVEAQREGIDHELVVAVDDAAARNRLTPNEGDRSPSDAPGPSRADHTVVLDQRRHELRSGGGVVELKGRPVLQRLLHALAATPGQGVAKNALAWAIWSRPFAPGSDDNALRSNVTHLRRLIEDAGFHIEFDGNGYRLIAPDGFVYLRA